MNLLSNAIKFTPEGGRITVRVRRDEQGRLVMTVADTGVGIAPEDRDVIFEKFRQGSSALGGDMLTRSHPGTGLGLSIVRELAILLGGEVTLESELGKGSAFTVRLPWACADSSRRDAELSARIDDLTAPRRVEMKRSARPSGSTPAVIGNPVGNAASSAEPTRS
jgi:signal transduction histidine kinase